MRRIKYNRVHRAVVKAIELNPQIIKVTEKGKIEVDGAFKNINNSREIKGVVYVEKTNQINIDTSTKDTSFINQNFQMVAREDSALISDSRVRTTIECIEGKFLIDYVNEIVVEDKIVMYWCGLKRID